MNLTTTKDVSVDGVMQGLKVCRPTGRPQYATATADLKHAT